MWSHLYDYYEIRSSENYSVYEDMEKGIRTLDSFPELIHLGKGNYKNAEGYPWITVSLSRGSRSGYGGDDGDQHPYYNIIPIVCAKSENSRIPITQLDFLRRLAQRLQWELVQQTNDDDEEYVIVWQP